LHLNTVGTADIVVLSASGITDAISTLTAPGDYFGDDRTVTVSEAAVDMTVSPLPGVEDGELA